MLHSLLSGNPELHRPNCKFLSVSKIDNLKAQTNLHVSNRTHRAFVATEETTRSRSSQANTSKKTQTCLPNLRSMSAVLLGFLWQRAANLRRNPMRATEAWPLAAFALDYLFEFKTQKSRPPKLVVKRAWSTAYRCSTCVRPRPVERNKYSSCIPAGKAQDVMRTKGTRPTTSYVAVASKASAAYACASSCGAS